MSFQANLENPKLNEMFKTLLKECNKNIFYNYSSPYV